MAGTGNAHAALEVAIVGAGLAGAATAWHLARAGVSRITLLERERLPGAHSSGRNAAIVRGDAAAKALQPLWTESATALAGGTLAGFRRTGGLLVGCGPEDVAAHVPLAAGRGTLRADDGVVDVAGLLATYLRGQDVRVQTEVRGLARRGGRWRVETSRGPLDADVVVNAAGAWAGRLGDLPLTPLNRHLHVTPPLPAVDPDGPYVWDEQVGYYFRPESGGLLLSACEEVPGPPGEPAVDPASLEGLAGKLAAHQPALAGLPILRSWVGQRTFATDRRPVIGFDPRGPGLLHVAGLGGFGVTLSYAAGRLAADLVLARAAPDPRVGVARLLAPAASARA